MYTPPFSRSLAAPLFALPLLAAQPLPVSAASPLVPISASFTIPAGPDTCAFDLAGSEAGFLKYGTDHRGGATVATVGIHEHGAFTNPANGRSVSFVVAETQAFSLNPDGGTTVVSVGLQGILTIPGQGVVAASVGRLVQTIDPSGTLVSTDFQAGQWSGGPFPAICPYLS
jgi:hypothetical protein